MWYFFFCYDENIDLKKAIKSLELLKNRGPDYIHYDIKNNIFLGQTVLSIVGKYKKSNFVKDNYTLLFNGEIYNYKQFYNYDSDTKALVNMFGEYNFKDLISKLDGMYCFVCFDSKNNNIYISRVYSGRKRIILLY